MLHLLSKKLIAVVIGVAIMILGTFHIASAAPAVIGSSSYILSVDDTLDISVLGHTDLQKSVRILPDGTINYPIIGTVHAAGKTIQELKETLVKGLSDQYNQPEVSVAVVDSRPRKVSVLGAVHQPGLYDYKEGWHVMQALAASGGLLQDPMVTSLTLITSNGKNSKNIDVEKLLDDSDNAANLSVAPGDVLLFQARDPSTAQVQIIGEVTKPGPYMVPRDGATVVSLLAQAGGATSKAALSRAQIMHTGQIVPLDLRWLNNKLDSKAATRLVAGDVLMIPANEEKVAVLGAVVSPAVYTFPDGQGLSATTAVALAGGPTSEAERRKVMILRHNNDGTQSNLSINLDDYLKGQNTKDVVLQPGDIIYVPNRKKGSDDWKAIAGIVPGIGWLLK